MQNGWGLWINSEFVTVWAMGQGQDKMWGRAV
jgi:hypothetical protein